MPRRKTMHARPEREKPLQETDSDNAWILDLQSPGLWQSECLLKAQALTLGCDSSGKAQWPVVKQDDSFTMNIKFCYLRQVVS